MSLCTILRYILSAHSYFSKSDFGFNAGWLYEFKVSSNASGQEFFLTECSDVTDSASADLPAFATMMIAVDRSSDIANIYPIHNVIVHNANNALLSR